MDKRNILERLEFIEKHNSFLNKRIKLLELRLGVNRRHVPPLTVSGAFIESKGEFISGRLWYKKVLAAINDLKKLSVDDVIAVEKKLQLQIDDLREVISEVPPIPIQDKVPLKLEDRIARAELLVRGLQKRTREFQRKGLIALDDVTGALDIIWSIFIGPLWEKYAELKYLVGPIPEEVIASSVRKVEDVIRDYTLNALRKTGGNKTQTAKLLGINVKTLYNWFDRWEKRNKDSVHAKYMDFGKIGK